MRLIDIYRAFHLKTEYKLFSSTHGTFFRTDHTIDYNTSFIKFQKTENMKHHFQPQHYETKHQLQGEKKEQKHKHVEGKQYALNNQ